MSLADRWGRPLRNLRISVTDRCNLRCQYCMPEEDYTWLPHAEILTFEEIGRLVDVFVGLGVDKVRLTGGEPLLRRELGELIRILAAKPGLREVALTTNGVYLAEQAKALKQAGLHRVTVSLDTLDAARFERLARRDDHARVLEGLAAVGAAGLSDGFKIDTVVMRGVNDDEMIDMVELGTRYGAEVRFIEYMDVGGATQWSADDVVSRREILERLSAHFGAAKPVEEKSSAPARRFRLPDGRVFGIISSTTQPFCQSCDRSRLTADGMWYLCLYARTGLDLRALLRGGAIDGEMAAAITGSWLARTDRGAEERLAVRGRAALADADELRRDPHLEMHTRGG